MTRRLALALLSALATPCATAADPVYTDGDSLHIRLPDQTHFYRHGLDVHSDPICSVGYKYEYDVQAKVARYLCMAPERVSILPAEPALVEPSFVESKGWRLHVHAELGYWSGQVPQRVIEYRDCNFAIPPQINPDGSAPIVGDVREAWNCRRIGFPLILFDSGFE